jgi:hypothetical protein
MGPAPAPIRGTRLEEVAPVHDPVGRLVVVHAELADDAARDAGLLLDLSANCAFERFARLDAPGRHLHDARIALFLEDEQLGVHVTLARDVRDHARSHG